MTIEAELAAVIASDLRTKQLGMQAPTTPRQLKAALIESLGTLRLPICVEVARDAADPNRLNIHLTTRA